MSQSIKHHKFWQERYQARQWPWDLGEASPHLTSLFEQPTISETLSKLFQTLPKPPASIIVPGAGRAHDAVYLARLGYQVTCVDLVEEAKAHAESIYPEWIPAKVDYQVLDFLTLPGNSKWKNQFDIAFEHTCFCALPLEARKDYANALHWTLKPRGLLLGVFWQHPEPGGPPYSSTVEERQACFAETFELIDLYDATQNAGNSANRRDGQETLMLWRKK